MENEELGKVKVVFLEDFSVPRIREKLSVNSKNSFCFRSGKRGFTTSLRYMSPLRG